MSEESQASAEEGATSASKLSDVVANTRIDGKILIILSGAGSIELSNGKTLETGFFMNELAIPGRALKKTGAELVYATPGGAKPHMDPGSDKPSFFHSEDSYKKHRAFLKKEGLLNGEANVKSFEEVLKGDLSKFRGIFVPGGLAPTVDLAASKPLGKVLSHFHSEQKPTAMLCHGPSALLSTLDDPASLIDGVNAGKKIQEPENWPYRGYKLTVISESEDKSLEEKVGGGLRFYPESVLRGAGANVEVKDRKKGFVVQDKELITGQNPMADREFTIRFLHALADNR
jgi:putative intracellular protease/amidase